MKFKYLEHTADIKFRAYGKNLEKVFINSALAMKNSLIKKRIKKRVEKKIKVKGKDLESLMYNFLEEILFLLDTEFFILSKIKKIKINEKKFELEAELVGDLVHKYEFGVDIKAITYNEMFVKREGNKWISQVVLDV